MKAGAIKRNGLGDRANHRSKVERVISLCSEHLDLKGVVFGRPEGRRVISDRYPAQPDESSPASGPGRIFWWGGSRGASSLVDSLVLVDSNVQNVPLEDPIRDSNIIT